MTTIRCAALALALSFPALARSSAKAASPEVQIQCTDGSMGKAGRGACSHHGGVAKGSETSRGQASTTAKPAPEPQARQAPEARPSPRQYQNKQAPAAPPVTEETRPPAEHAQEAKPAKSPWSIFGKKSQGRAAEPAPRSAPAARTTNAVPTAKCRDGSLSYSAHHSGSCSHHGGVAQFLDAK